ncbi:MAG: VanW family protein [Defluviitaleaceae bacterium]|nr:VanW family protein [Defluviitaleaceae bacterium]
MNKKFKIFAAFLFVLLFAGCSTATPGRTANLPDTGNSTANRNTSGPRMTRNRRERVPFSLRRNSRTEVEMPAAQAAPVIPTAPAAPSVSGAAGATGATGATGAAGENHRTHGRTTPTVGHLAHAETQYDATDKNRGNNIAIAASSINGAIINPGETFSYNATIGSTTKEYGYKKAVIFADGKKSKNYGGGVCQVSTTLCCAAIDAGMKILERHDHSLPVTYAQEGREAATSQNGKLDFKFENTEPYPVVIHANGENGTVSVSISQA